MAAKFEIKKSSDGEFHFHLKAGNGEIILTSELYKTKASALNGIESVKKNAPLDERYERKVDKAGKPRFNLKAANHEIIGSSQAYHSEEAREHGIAAVKADAPTATVDDQAA
jgi:uncharacterized protein YegP (UPF0339 family)